MPRVFVPISGKSRHGSRLALLLSAACLVMLCRYISSTPALTKIILGNRATDALYNGDALHRLCQEIVLGMGGCRHVGGARLQAHQHTTT